MTHPTTFDLQEKAETEFALKKMMAEHVEAGFREPGKNGAYIAQANALRKIMQTDGVEYYKTVHELREIQY